MTNDDRAFTTERQRCAYTVVHLGSSRGITEAALSPPLDLADDGVSGFRASLNERGRLVIPAGIRDRLDLGKGDTVEVLVRRGDADA